MLDDLLLEVLLQFELHLCRPLIIDGVVDELPLYGNNALGEEGLVLVGVEEGLPLRRVVNVEGDLTRVVTPLDVDIHVLVIEHAADGVQGACLILYVVEVTEAPGNGDATEYVLHEFLVLEHEGLTRLGVPYLNEC
jgi:hypothetical protein